LGHEKQSQTKPIYQPSAGNTKNEARNTKQLHITEPKLKKQSQFAGRQIGVRFYLKGTYGNIPPCRARKNKAKQSQFVGVVESAQTIPIPMHDNRDEAATHDIN
jgi:hypothetical protein